LCAQVAGGDNIVGDQVNLGRRTLLGGIIAVAALHPRTSAAVSRSTETAPQLAELSYGQVQMGAGALAAQAGETHRLVMGLDEDSLLLPYRSRAGQPAPGPELGGWYGTDAFAPGSQFGQWMSALARFHATTGDDPTRAKVRRLVRGFAATIDARGSFYEHNRFPCYTYDKLVGGLLDAARLCGDEAALPTLARATSAALPHLPPHVMPRNEHRHLDEFGQYSWDESYTLPENQFLAWRATGERRHLELARRMLYRKFFGALARGENALPGKHAYSHVNSLSSAVQAYLTEGDPMYLAAAQRGFEFVAAQSYATGGWGPAEHFIVPGSGALGAGLVKEHNSFETPCGAYAHFKLTRYLLRITRDSRYGDSMERVMYNTVLGALPIRPDGQAFYFSDYSGRAHKGFHKYRWPCCSGTLPMIATDYAISTCFTDPEGIFVNLYVPAAVNWVQDGKPCSLKIETDYPYEPLVVLTLQLPEAQTFALNVRIPAWSQGAQLRVNGRLEPASLEPGTFAAVRREWRSGDRIELELPLGRDLESVDAEHPNLVALRSGPLVLMRILDDTAPSPLARQSLLAAMRDPGGAHAWQVPTDRGPVTLKAFADIASEQYSAYQAVLPS
jgi:DUF1680 family protein